MKKILIIDDDNKNIFALSAMLKSKGYSVLASVGAEDGLQQLYNNPDIGIVLMDMMMPELDGYEAIKIIRNNERLKNMPVIALTAQAMMGDKEKCLAAGANNYISKPVDVDVLLALLTQYLKN